MLFLPDEDLALLIARHRPYNPVHDAYLDGDEWGGRISLYCSSECGWSKTLGHAVDLSTVNEAWSAHLAAPDEGDLGRFSDPPGGYTMFQT